MLKQIFTGDAYRDDDNDESGWVQLIRIENVNNAIKIKAITL